MPDCTRTEDQPCLRFLWPPKNSIQQFRYTFGARCSPTTAKLVLQQTTEDFENTATTKVLILNSFYMEDFVQSLEVDDVFWLLESLHQEQSGRWDESSGLSPAPTT